MNGYIVLVAYRLLRFAAGPRRGTVRRTVARRREPPRHARNRWSAEVALIIIQAAVYAALRKAMDRGGEAPAASRAPAAQPEAARPRVEDLPMRNALTLGGAAHCLDGDCGELSRILLDPVSRRITHVVVSDLGDEAPGWLVPVGSAVPASGQVQLACSTEELHHMDLADPSRVAMQDEDLGTVRYAEDSLDVAAVRPEETVRTEDGVAGRACGVVTDPGDAAQMTHLLVEMGQRRKRVAVPLAWISSLEGGGVQLTMPASEVWGLPAWDEAGS